MRASLLGDRDFYRSILAIGLPVALQNLLATTASMIDTMMLGTQGELAVAAVGISSQFASLMFSAYFGFCNGGMLFFAQYWGARDEKGICRAYGVTLSFMMLVGLLFGFVSVAFPHWVLSVYTDKPAIQQIGVQYLRITGWSFPLQVLAMAISSLMRSTENVKSPLYASIASLLTNMVVNYLLIFGRFGLPAMGVRGAAVGTVVSSVVNVTLLYLLAMRDKEAFILRFREQFRWMCAFMRQYFQKSLPMIGNELLYGVGQMLINIVVGRQAEAGISAMAVFRVIEGLIFAFFVGLSSASGVLVGKKIGAGDHEGGFLDAKRFALICPMVTLLICLCLLPVRGPLLRVFGLGDTALQYGKWMLLVYTVAGTVRTCNYMMNNCFRAGGEPVFGTVLEISCLFLITVPLTWCAGIVWKLPFLAVFGFMYIDEFLRLAVELGYLRSGRWVKPVTSEGIATLSAFKESLTDKRARRGRA